MLNAADVLVNLRVYAGGSSMTEAIPEKAPKPMASRSTTTGILLGVLLIGAAALKAYELATGPTIRSSFLGSRWFLTALVEFEIVLGVWLISGWAWKKCWWAALITFSGFGLITLYQAVAGYESCGCFGKLKVSPWYTLILDMAALAGLLWSRPSIDCSGSGADYKPIFGFGTVSALCNASQ